MKKKVEENLSNAVITFETGQYDKAIQWCNIVLDESPNNAKAYFLKGTSFLVLEDFEHAEQCLKKAIDLQPQNGEYYFYLGNCYYKMNDIHKALDNFAKAERTGISDKVKMKMFYIVGVINQIRNEYDEALIYFKKSEEIKGINPDQRDIFIRKIQIYVKRREMELAEDCARSLKFLAPNEFGTYQLLFQVYVPQKKNKEAEQLLDEASEVFKNDNTAQIEIGFNYAMIHILLADETETAEQMNLEYKKAMQYLIQLLSNPGLSLKDQYQIFLILADVYHKMGDIDNVIKMSEKVVNSPDETLTGYMERARHNLVESYLRKKQYQKVQKYAAELKQSKESMYSCYGYYMEAYSQMKMAESAPDLKASAMKMYQIAIAYFRNCMAAGGGDIIALTYRIKANADIGEFKKADELCQLLPVEAREEIIKYIKECKD